MERFDVLILGFGKAGKTLAATLAAKKFKVGLVERSALRYGGTCINVGCIPSKSLETSARQSAALGGDFEHKAVRYRQAVEEKGRLTAMLRTKNYQKLVSAGVQVWTGEAEFLDEHRVQVTFSDGTRQEVWGDSIVINTGSQPSVPPIAGLRESRRVYTSETLMQLETLPERLVILGGGYIGAEFSSYYANFGSKVTILQDGDAFLPREDAEMAAAVLAGLEKRGVQLLRSIRLEQVSETGEELELRLSTPQGPVTLQADALLVATGRIPAVEALHPEKAGVALTPRGAIQVDEQLRTTVPHIWAVGDVTGGLQFTYISLDDFRIVRDQLLHSGSRTTQNRGAIPYTVFLDPPLARVGLTQAQALQQGFSVGVAAMPAAAIPKAQVLQKTEGLLKLVVDLSNGQILGAHLYCAESHEMINLVKLAMDAELPYTVLQETIYTHPTMSEAFNDLAGLVKPVAVVPGNSQE